MLKTAFEKASFNFPERAFYPHIKLANMHMDKLMHTERKLENFPNEELSRVNFMVKKIIMYESKLLLHHPHYYPLLEINLI